MELKIYNPQEGGFVKAIEWNNEELKAEIAEKVKDYEGLVYVGEAQIKEAKADRANLNKLRTAIEDERKRIKKLCLEPYNQFEAQVKEVIALLDRPIAMIGEQIEAAEEAKKAAKKAEIEELFKSIGFQDFVTLEAVWDPKWLNATTSMTKIEEAMKERMYQIGSDVLTLHELSEYSFEAMEVYKQTLDLNAAIREGKRLLEIQKAKEAQAAREAEEKAERERLAAEAAKAAQDAKEKAEAPAQEAAAVPEERQVTIIFKVTAKESQFAAVNQALAGIQRAGASLEILQKEEG